MTSRYKAYWISPGGDIIPVPGKHIGEVVRTPKRFGFTPEYIRSIFQKYNEPLGFEGKARQVLMRDLIERGWVRLRFQLRPYGWRVQLLRLDEANKSMLLTWEKQENISTQDKNIEFYVTTGNGKERIYTTFFSNHILYLQG